MFGLNSFINNSALISLLTFAGLLSLPQLVQAQATQKLDATIQFRPLPNSHHDSDVNEEVVRALISEGFRRTNITPNFVRASREPLHLHFRINYLYIANTNTRTMVGIIAVRNHLEHTTCSVDVASWSQTQIGDGTDIRNAIRGMPADLQRLCLTKAS